MNTSTKPCPYCFETIKSEALKCKHCGEILDARLKKARALEQKQSQPQARKWSPGVAALLSFLIPGAGQMYKGHVGAGLAWLFFVFVGYSLFIVPGLVLHLICILTAATGDPYR